VFPNPSANLINIQLELNQVSNVTIDITDITGKIVAVIANEKQSGLIKKQFNTSSLVNGNYIIRLTTNQKTVTQQLSVNH
jgi:nitrate reductase NapAB chaperone NapD